MYGIGEAVTIDTFPRGLSGYVTTDHPSYGLTYLVRAKAGRRSFFYVLDSTDVVTEHFLLSGADMTLLELPNFIGEDKILGRTLMPSHRVVVAARR